MRFAATKALAMLIMLPAVLIAAGFFCAAFADDAAPPSPTDSSRMFFVTAEELSSADPAEIVGYATENGYTHIIAELGADSDSQLLSALSAAASGDGVGLLTLAAPGADSRELTALSEKCVLSGIVLNAGTGLADAGSMLELLRGEYADVPLGLYIPLGAGEVSADAAALISDWHGKGLCDFIMARNLFSSYSEYGYAQELTAWLEAAGDVPFIPVSDISRVLEPVTSGDFFADPYEINYQYQMSTGCAGFAVQSWSALARNAYGCASSLSSEFADGTLLSASENFKLSSTFAITRPAGGEGITYSSKYTIFGSSDPDVPLYCDGAPVERLSSSGLFAIQVDVGTELNRYTFTQGGASRTATLRRPDTETVTTISKITSAYPYYQEGIRVGDTVTLSCIAPSGGAVTATVDGQYVKLSQVAATAYYGVPATYKAEFVFTGRGSYPENETVDIGPVVYTLVYNGVSSYTTEGSFVVLASQSEYVVRCVNPLGGIETNAADEGNYITTLKPGCTDTVVGSDGGWLLLSCGGYISKANVEAVLGESPTAHNTVSALNFGSDERGDWLSLDCSVLPAFKVDWGARFMIVTLYNTEFSASSPAFPGGVFRRLASYEGEGGSSVLSFIFSDETWGYSIETDEDDSVLKIYVRKRPVLSESLSSPLEGIVVTIDAGHGGVDPGALSVAGVDGVTEADINAANAAVLKDALERLGAEVIYNYAVNSEKLEFRGRMDPAEEAKTDIYISLHSNSVAESTDPNLYYGTEVYYYYEHSSALAKLLAENISDATGRDNEGAHQSYYRVTRMSFAPSVLVECGYVSHPRELESLIDPLIIEKTVNAIIRSVMAVLEG